MKDRAEFSVTFRGEAVENGHIDVRDLVPSLLAMDVLIEEINQSLGADAGRVKLRIREQFSGGSFVVPFEILHDIGQQVVAIVTGEEANAAFRILGMLGLGKFGIIPFVQWLRGRRFKEIGPDATGRGIEVQCDDGETIVVPREVLVLLGRAAIRRGLRDFFSPLGRDGMDSVEFSAGENRKVVVTREDAEFFSLSDDPSMEQSQTLETVLQVLGPSFKPGTKWRFRDDQSDFLAPVSDSTFLQKVHERQLKFGEGDCLEVTMRIKRRMENGKLRGDREILRVRKHIEAAPQGDIEFDPKGRI